MSGVVSDTSPLHYLILCGAESVLPRLFNQIDTLNPTRENHPVMTRPISFSIKRDIEQFQGFNSHRAHQFQIERIRD